ncbi:hypothetical protein FG386_003692 [Cryptosporidium ryanae]|uniref:uncharacterized protein n=1 Tax=Cryptosporidium ryanae TaxID=515981 RepID=UPI00351A9688|nr:hypothetical protein FG386_003692 [Cryptosporidium ryanae]
MNPHVKEYPSDWYSLQERALKLSDQAFRSLIEEFEDQIRNLKNEIIFKDKRITDLKNKLDYSCKQINTLKSEKSELCNLLDALDSKLKGRDARIEEAFSDLAELKGDYEQFLEKIERCHSKFMDASRLSGTIIDSHIFHNCAERNYNEKKCELLKEQSENIEIKEIPELMMSEAIMHPSNFIFCPLNCANNNEQNPSNSSKFCSESSKMRTSAAIGEISNSVSKSGVWNRISQVLPSESYFSLLNFVRQYHLGLISEEELQTEIQNALLSNNEAVRSAFTKDILNLSAK